MDGKYLLIQLSKACYVAWTKPITSGSDYKKQFH